MEALISIFDRIDELYLLMQLLYCHVFMQLKFITWNKGITFATINISSAFTHGEVCIGQWKIVPHFSVSLIVSGPDTSFYPYFVSGLGNS